MNDKILEQIKKTLPTEKGIMGRDDYFNSAVLVPLIKIENEYHLLYQKRAASIRQGSEICFPGGAFDEELDHNFEETAIRETCEELGITKESFKVIGFLDTHIAPMGAIIEPYVGVMNNDIMEKLKLDPAEVESVFTIPLKYFLENEPEIYKARLEIQAAYTDKEGNKKVLLPAKELGLPERYYSTWGGKKHKVYVYKTEHGILWGLTAVITMDLINRLRD